ncbi:flagellar biosynthesis protein FlhF [Thalassolituus sp.]|jgi:flagellar biosynthesis protein FlhF|uniref:flagellar biosynthesis protein FlhF n=1 Tax=Thalassolituus sp. TaxID=2030822 RepID=UPI002A83BA41|nr:flagellar biosynthesis protein FlhF [Thalassolituus sp.]|tara:strand:- start:13 stop:1392 length:1380 start_codon:yes stop_codon:yes gene_type:complete
MNVKRFVAANMQQALRLVSQELGPDAVIMSSKKIAEGFEVVAALDYQSGQEASSNPEVERQLRLQRELEAAKSATRQAELQRQRTADRVAFAEQSDLTSRDGIREALAGLRPGAQPAGQTAAEKEMAVQVATAKPTLAKNDDGSHVYNSRLQEMQGELRELKDWMVSHQGSAWDTRRPLTWQQSQLWQRCQDMGIEPAWADRIASNCAADVAMDDAWKAALKQIAGDLPITPAGLLERGGRIALVGPTGAGKTTTIGKIAAQFVMRHGAKSVAFVTLDNYRVAAHDQLKAFSRILGVEMRVVIQGGDLAKTLHALRDKKLVLVDSAGLGSQDPHFSLQLSMLKQAGAGLSKLLVLPLTSQGRCLQENFEHFKAAGLSGCIFTKLDECFSLGPGMSIAALGHLPVTLVTDGPHIPDDLHYPDAMRLVNLAEQMARMARTRWQAAEAMNMATQQTSFQHGV